MAHEGTGFWGRLGYWVGELATAAAGALGADVALKKLFPNMADRYMEKAKKVEANRPIVLAFIHDAVMKRNKVAAENLIAEHEKRDRCAKGICGHHDFRDPEHYPPRAENRFIELLVELYEKLAESPALREEMFVIAGKLANTNPEKLEHFLSMIEHDWVVAGLKQGLFTAEQIVRELDQRLGQLANRLQASNQTSRSRLNAFLDRKGYRRIE